MSLSRVGGASDGGVDLQGWWWLPALSSPQHEQVSPPTQDSHLFASPPARRRLRVLAQCKAHAKKMGPHAVREMEGVLHQYQYKARPNDPSHSSHLRNTEDQDPYADNNNNEGESAVALLISQSPFTRQTILRTMSSSVPFLLLHLPEQEHGPALGTPRFPMLENNKPGDGGIGTAVWNAALAGPQGPLGGEYEVRWVRTPTEAANKIVGHPSLCRHGQPVESLVPPSVVSKHYQE